MTTDAPRSSASRVWPRPGSSTVVSNHSGSGMPTSVAVWVTRARSARASPLQGLKTTAGGPPRGSSAAFSAGPGSANDGVRRRTARQVTSPSTTATSASTRAATATHASQVMGAT